MDKDTDIVRTSLRLNKRLYDKLAEAADLHGLTMHAEIIRRLNETVEMDNYVPQENIHTDDRQVVLSREEVEALLYEAAAKALASFKKKP